MMPRTIYKPIAWFLIATLAIVAGVGEGLHWIPGCGHGVEVGNSILLLGISAPEDTSPADGRSHVERPADRDIPICDEDLCSICSAVARDCTSADGVQFVFVMPFVHEVSAVAPCDAPTATARLFQSRAPPLA